MNKHTPGPWKQADGEPGFIYALNDTGSNQFWLQVSRGWLDRDQPTSDEEIAANASLILAAPELLAALERSLDRLSSYKGGGAEGVWLQARQAVSKARGEKVLTGAKREATVTES